MKIYVAGSSRDLPRARAMMDALRARGHEIAFDWVAHIDRSGGRSNRGLNIIERFDASTMCLDGVRHAEVVALLIPADDAPGKGAWVELGYAIARGMTVHAIGDVDSSIFTSFCQRWADDAAFLTWLDLGPEDAA